MLNFDNPQGPAGGAPRGAFLNRSDRRRHCEDETPAGSASRHLNYLSWECQNA